MIARLRDREQRQLRQQLECEPRAHRRADADAQQRHPVRQYVAGVLTQKIFAVVVPALR